MKAVEPEHLRRLEHMYSRAPVNGIFEPRIEVFGGRARLAMHVDERYHHAGGAVHGSVLFKALDDAAFFAANSIARNHCLLTFSFQLTLLRPVRSGELTAEGNVVGETGRFVLADAELVDEEGRALARGSGTFARSALRFDELPDYVAWSPDAAAGSPAG